MKEYELTVLFHPDLEMNIDPALDKVKKIITSAGGEITKEDAEGKKRLAYTIKGQEFAIFYYFTVSLPADAPGKISTVMNITDEVIRYLLVRADTHRAKLATAAEPEDDSSESNQEKGE